LLRTEVSIYIDSPEDQGYQIIVASSINLSNSKGHLTMYEKGELSRYSDGLQFHSRHGKMFLLSTAIRQPLRATQPIQWEHGVRTINVTNHFHPLPGSRSTCLDDAVINQAQRQFYLIFIFA
jgi:hypothetical protein